ncbi:hypothetical protein H7U32_03200 [Bifidobacterium pullorum subsp. saeculare]|uniref:Uncharacterized protein n=1 Tax=Bifidobacterium pullorum subsp. saeculare TaxID=78257 RepID=A0A938WXC4_9BIFI|nr:hypothetical protein [Bifidobacterium pullorum]MBM6699343.1 hypothetical protein [Bifidobacterium pullorum subsp. saeculare]
MAQTGDTELEVAERDGVRIIRDGAGILFLGDADVIDAELSALGLRGSPIPASQLMGVTGRLFQVAGQAAADSGRWLKLTEESMDKIQEFGFRGTGVLRRENGRIAYHLTFKDLKGARALANPTALAGIGGMMTQFALEQAIAEVKDYLERMDAKLDDLLQDQQDQKLGELAGAAGTLDEAIAVRDQVGTIGEASWSQVAPCAQSINTAQGYALNKLMTLSTKLADTPDASRMEQLTDRARNDVRQWTSILAYAVRLRDELHVLELDRVMEVEPQTVERHREGIVVERRNRMERIRGVLEALADGLEDSSRRLSGQKLLHPLAVSHAQTNMEAIAGHLRDFAQSLDIDLGQTEIDRALPWRNVAGRLIADAAEQAGDALGEFGSMTAKAAAEGAARVRDGVGSATRAISRNRDAELHRLFEEHPKDGPSAG